MPQAAEKIILLVEDDPLLALNEKRLLEGEGYQVQHASNGEEAVALMCEQNLVADLILMDINLGDGMDGIEAARRILARRDLPLIFLSSYAQKEVVEKTEEITSYGYVVKNSNPNVLLASIKMAFHLYEAHLRLRENEKNLRDAQRLTHIGSWRWLIAGDVVTWSEELYHINQRDLRLPAPSYAEMSAYYTLESWQRLDAAVRRAMQSGERYELELELVQPDGSIRITFSRGEPDYDLSGNLIGLHGTVQDITERKQMEEALKASQLRYQTLVEASPDAITMTDLQGRILACNPQAARLHGFNDVADMQQYAIQQLFPAAEFEQIRRRVLHSAQQTEAQQIECTLLRKDGSSFIGELSVAALCDGAGRPEAIIGISRDITARKQMEQALHKKTAQAARDVDRFKEAEEALQKSAAQYHSLVAVLREGIVLYDSSGAIIANNQAAEDILGLTGDQLRGRTSVDPRWRAVHEDGSPFPGETHPAMQTLRTGEEHHNVMMGVHKPDGSLTWILVSSQPIWKGDVGEGLPAAVAVSFMDITERKRMEDELRLERFRLANILQGTNAGTWEWNVQSGETIFNQRWAEIVGYTLEELAPVSIETWVRFVHPEDIQRSNELLQQHFAGELDYYECEARMRHKNGEWVWVLDRGRVAAWTEDGKPLWMFGTHQDITRRKRAEERNLLLLREKELLLQEVHHRIKNNMNTIVSLLQLQMAMQVNLEVQAALQQAGTRLQSMMVLYDQLYRSENFDTLALSSYLSPLLEQIMALFPQQNPVRLEMQFEEITLGQKWLSPLGMLLNELTTNAMKYAFVACNDGLIQVTAARQGGEVVVTFADNGMGLPEDFRLEDSRGFGMQLVGMLTLQLRGSITVYNHGGPDGRGVKFVLRFTPGQGGVKSA